MPLDGSSVLASTLLAPGSQSFVTPGPLGTAWVDGSLSLPLLPLTPLSNIGNSFAARVNAASLIDQTARFGGIAASNPNAASAPVALTSIAVDASGNPLLAGSVAPSASQSLLATQTFDLPLENAPTAAFPSTVRAAVLPASACNGSLCAGFAAYLARLTIPANSTAAMASLALSLDDSPNLTLRNLGSAEAPGLQISANGFTFVGNCGTTLAAGAECSITLTGTGPGSISVSANNSATQTQTLPAIAVRYCPARCCLLAEGTRLWHRKLGQRNGHANHNGYKSHAAESDVLLRPRHQRQDHPSVHRLRDRQRLHARRWRDH